MLIRYVIAVRHSGMFQRAHYRAQRPGLLGSILPVVHYVLWGESRKFSPFDGFWPEVYLKMNPDIADAGERPFLHYIRYGRQERRQFTRNIFPRELPATAPLSQVPLPRIDAHAWASARQVAACVHIYYPEIWPEIRASLARIRNIADVFVSVAYRDSSSPGLVEAIRTELPEARVYLFPNHGRDIFPFIYLANAGCFRRYQAVCKLHTKLSPHLIDGASWRTHLIDGILPRQGLRELLEEFLCDTRAGILVAGGQIYQSSRWMGENNARFESLVSRLGMNTKHEFRFPAGSVYWIKPRLLSLIEQLNLQIDDFELESGQLDGTTAHAFERVLGHLAQAADLTIKEAQTPWAKKFRRIAVGPLRGCKNVA